MILDRTFRTVEAKVDKMDFIKNVLLFSIASILTTESAAHLIHTTDFHFRVEAGERTCFFEHGKAGQMMEVYYQVVDGQHGDLDISLDVIDPDGGKIVADYKKPQNSIISELVLEGEYAICLDNSFSTFNSKLVFVYVMLEARDETEAEAVVTVVNSDGKEVKQIEVLNWMSTDEDGEPYYIEVEQMANSLSRTLKRVLEARHMMDLYRTSKTRDSYLAVEETFVVDMWSSFQISFMCIVGMLQVYMIKKLFKNPTY